MTASPAEQGILFHDAMVQAILDGRKTVTRRLTRRAEAWEPGQRLWVRESHALLHVCCWRDLPHRSVEIDDHRLWSFYRTGFDRTPIRWRSSLFMPRWASRLDLRVVSVTHEPLWSAGLRLLPTVDDAEARLEGVPDRAAYCDLWSHLHPTDDDSIAVTRVEFALVADRSTRGLPPWP